MPANTDTAAFILRAVELRRRHRIPECLDVLNRALVSDPCSARARYELAFAQLLSGNYIDGFRNYESRWEAAGLPRPVHTDKALLGPEWRGEPIEGKRLLLHAEQGFGDTIQFVRYAPLVAALGADVTLEVQPQLRGFADCIESGCTPGDGTPRGLYDFHRSLIDLPAVFGTTLDSVPPPTRIAIPFAKQQEWQTRIPRGDRINIGLVWGGNPNNSTDLARSIPLAALEPVLHSLPQARFFSFQLGAAADQVTNYLDRVADLRPDLRTFIDTAAALKRMNRIVTVDTAVAHLAGSLGLDVALLLSHSPCWRWLLGTNNSPWYPSMRLIRQTAPGNWKGVVEELQKVLYNIK